MSTSTAKQQEQQSAVPVVVSAAPEDAFMEHVLVGMAEFYSKKLSSTNKERPNFEW